MNPVAKSEAGTLASGGNAAGHTDSKKSAPSWLYARTVAAATLLGTGALIIAGLAMYRLGFILPWSGVFTGLALPVAFLAYGTAFAWTCGPLGLTRRLLMTTVVISLVLATFVYVRFTPVLAMFLNLFGDTYGFQPFRYLNSWNLISPVRTPWWPLDEVALDLVFAAGGVLLGRRLFTRNASYAASQADN